MSGRRKQSRRRRRRAGAVPKMEGGKKVNENPHVLFDITIGGKQAGRMVMELYAHEVPITAENFRACVLVTSQG